MICWKDLSPRVALTYAVDADRKTVLRASYARYAGQLNSFETTSNNAAGTYYPYVAYNWVDRNGDHLATRDEGSYRRGVDATPSASARNRDGNHAL